MLKEFDQDTIVAISTALGEGGVGVVRLSGGKAIEIADKIFKAKSKKPVSLQKTFTAQYGHVAAEEKIIDEVLVLLMRAPKSYTCEDVVEISAHGGPAVLKSILNLALQHGARLAQKGEFTKRAFLNGRIDLLQAEAVLDLVRAKTELGAEWAAQQLEGVLSKRVREAKDDLLKILSHLEAAIDFPDDFPETDSYEEIQNKLSKIISEFKNLLASFKVGALAKTGLKVVIAGRPNVGKSSLMNALSKTNRVIVTPIPGTTRDVVEEELEIHGFPVRLMDTAGIHDTEHPIEKEGIERSRLAVQEADLTLFVLDASQTQTAEDTKLLEGLSGRPTIVVLNKSDLPSKLGGKISGVACSCIQKDGTKKLEDEIFRFIDQGRVTQNAQALLSSTRQKNLVERTLASVQAAQTAIQEQRSPELVAVDVRAALDDLGLMVGEVLNDQMLDLLFDQFCIGK